MSSLDEFQTRYIDELIAAAAVLDSIEAAAQAEAWVSGAIAEWHALGGPAEGLTPAIAADAPLAAALISWMEGGEVPEGEHRWLADLGRHEISQVLQLASPSNPEELGLIFEFDLDGEHDHDVSVSLTNGTVTGIAIGPAGLADGVADDDTDLTVDQVGTSVASNLVTTALGGPLDALTPSSEANVPLLLQRFGGRRSDVAPRTEGRLLPERDAEDDSWCVGVVRSALRTTLEAAAPESVERARIGFAARVAKKDPDALTVLGVAGVKRSAGDGPIDVETFLRAVGAYFAPVDLGAHSDAQFDALIELEPVDWAGVVLGMTRAKTRTEPLDGASLVTFINRAPEITSTIPKSDAPRLAWAFEQMMFAWEATGVIDADGNVSDAGRWLLAHAYVAALSDQRAAA